MIFRLDYLIIAIYLLILAYAISTRRRILIYYLAVSSFMASVWAFAAKSEYGYNHDFLALYGINLLPVFAWSVGLFVIYLLYLHFEKILKNRSFMTKLIIFSAFYWPILILVETVGYHLLNVQNLATSAYNGLPICNCMHAPYWMQAAYFLMGPVFFSTIHILKLVNIRLKLLTRWKTL